MKKLILIFILFFIITLSLNGCGASYSNTINYSRYTQTAPNYIDHLTFSNCTIKKYRNTDSYSIDVEVNNNYSHTLKGYVKAVAYNGNEIISSTLIGLPINGITPNTSNVLSAYFTHSGDITNCTIKYYDSTLYIDK